MRNGNPLVESSLLIFSHHVGISVTFSFPLLHKNDEETSMVAVVSQLKADMDVSSGIHYRTNSPQGRKTSQTQLPLSSVFHLQPSGLSGYLGDGRAEHTNKYSTKTHIHTYAHTHTHAMLIMFNGFCGKLPNSLTILSFPPKFLHPGCFHVSFPLPSDSLSPSLFLYLKMHGLKK